MVEDRPNNRRRHRAWGRSVLAGLVVVFASLGFAAPAFAHNSVINISPEPGSVVSQQPGVITITTSDNLLDLAGDGGSNALQVSGPAGDVRYYGDGCATVSGATLQTEVQLGQPGEYQVVYQFVSADSHSSSDSFTFTWQPDAAQVLAAGSATPPTCASDGSSAAPADTDAAATDAADPGSGELSADLLWIGGAVVAVLAAIGATLLLLRRRPTP